MTIFHHEPVYRPILRQAFESSWKQKRLWIVSAVAGILLTGSVFDVVLHGAAALTPDRPFLNALVSLWGRLAAAWPSLSLSDIMLGSMNVLLFTAFCLIVAFTIFALSVIAQGTLVYAIGAGRRGRAPSFRDALTVGARAFWPVFVLNVLALTVLLATRGLIAVVYGIVAADLSGAAFLLYLLSFILFVIIGGLTVVVQIFALNAMILQGATLAQGIERGIRVSRRHWVVIVETIAILFVISVGASVLAIAAGMILTVPYFIIAFTAIALRSVALWSAVTICFIAVCLIALIALFGYLVQLHYAAWTLMYRKLGEGGVLPKMHRMARRFIHGYSVPGS
jgi:hypothetical protein